MGKEITRWKAGILTFGHFLQQAFLSGLNATFSEQLSDGH